MYANRNLCVKFLILLPLVVPLGFVALVQWVYIIKVLLYYTNPFLKFFLSTLFYTSTTLTVTNLFKCTFSNPGEVNRDWSTSNLSHTYFLKDKDKESFAEQYPSVMLDESYSTRKYQYCAKCRMAVPPKTGHCQMCNRCTLNFDHHCPWVANCIGFDNYKFFILFCAYGGLTSFILSVILLPRCFKVLIVDGLKQAVRFSITIV